MQGYFQEFASGRGMELWEYMPHHLKVATPRGPAHLTTRECWRTEASARLDYLWYTGLMVERNTKCLGVAWSVMAAGDDQPVTTRLSWSTSGSGPPRLRARDAGRGS